MDQDMAVETPEDIGPLLMHDPDEGEAEEAHSLSSHDTDNLLSDVQLPEGSNFLSAHLKDDPVAVHQSAVSLDKGSHLQMKPAGADDVAVDLVKFADGQPVQLEDGSTAYILTTYKEGTQPIILEDGTTAYISHEPPSSLFVHGLDSSSLALENIATISDSEEKRMGLSSQLSSEQKMFKCEEEGCGKTYSTFHHLQYHKRSHLEKKPFVCGFSGCEKTFATSYGLKSHIRVHTGEKPYKCQQDSCNKAFKTAGDLQKHIRTHTGEKPFRCPFEGCTRSFTTSNIRKVHIRTHTGERPYHCEHCGRSFASATNHKNHMRIHTGEKPYACTYEGCNKRFTEYSSLYKHHVVHTQTKPYICSICGKHYRQTSTLAMHRRTAHGENDVVIAPSDTDLMEGHLIALDQNKELVGIISNAGSKQLTAGQSAHIIRTAPSNGSKLESHISFADVDAQNVVVVTDPSCIGVLQSQVNTPVIVTSSVNSQKQQSDPSRLHTDPNRLHAIS